jgi:hypothetical protein
LRVDFQGSRATSFSGLLLVRELDEGLGLSALIAENIREDRCGKNTAPGSSRAWQMKVFSHT